MRLDDVLGVKELAPEERPRERLLRWGSATLKTSELIAIILNTGVKGEPVTAVAERMLADHGGLRGLMRMDAVELAQIRGVGKAKAAKLKAALELSSRIVALGPEERPQVLSPDDIVDLLGIEMSELDHEQLRVVLLDTKHRVMTTRTVYQGSVNQAQVRIGEVFRDAVRHNATAIVIVHNHPSGDPSPSAADISLTAELEQAGSLLGIDVLDHLIIGRGTHVSLKRLGLGFRR
jgi:DNA repair protein RadC